MADKIWLTFKLVENKPKTCVWDVIARETGYSLGQIRWHPAWRQYTFQSLGDIILATACLRQIAGFIEQRMAERR